MKLIYIVLLCFSFGVLQAQVVNQLSLDSVKTTAVLQKLQASKTSNAWDVLPNYIQLVAQDITSNNSGIQFSGSLFALYPKDSIHKYVNSFYLKNTWLRNTVLQGGVSLAKNNSITGVKIGFVIDILNYRDKSMFEYYNTPELKNLQNSLTDLIGNTESAIYSSQQWKGTADSLNKAINAYEKDSSKTKGLEAFIGVLNDSLYKKYRVKSYSQVWKKVTGIYDSISNTINNLSLLTLTPTAQYALTNNKLVIKTYDAAVEYIVGLSKKNSKMPWQLDSKLDGTIGDTAAGIINLKREVWSFNTGVNKVLLTAKDKKTSLMEFKFGGEVDHIMQDLKAGEKMYAYMGDIVLRVRAGSSFWIPLTIKYDITHHNFLGFLNINVNIDKSSGSSGGSSSSSAASSK